MKGRSNAFARRMFKKARIQMIDNTESKPLASNTVKQQCKCGYFMEQEQMA